MRRIGMVIYRRDNSPINAFAQIKMPPGKKLGGIFFLPRPNPDRRVYSLNYFFARTLSAVCANCVAALFTLASNVSTACLAVLVSCS